MDNNRHIAQLKSFFIIWNAEEATEHFKKIVYAALTSDELDANERADALNFLKKITPALLAAEMVTKL